jgi:uncharacterized radical SAM superfamily protein
MANKEHLLNEDNIEDLDFTWIQEFENIDKDYKNYYSEELQFIKIHSIYVDKENSIEKVKEENILLRTPGILQKEELLGIIKHNSFSNEFKYSLLSILKFNINILPENLNTYLRNKNENIDSLFLQSIKNIDSIRFEKSISLFHDINEIIIIFYQPNYKGDFTNHKTSSTKKIFINSIKKTKRKLFKGSIG